MLLRRFLRPPVGLLPLTEGQRTAVRDYVRAVAAGEYSLRRVPCLCGSSDGRLLAAYDRYGIPVTTFACRECGVLRSDPFLDDASLERFYSLAYRSIYSSGQTADAEFFAEQEKHGRLILERLDRAGVMRAGMTVFDIGCGAGGMLAAFRERGCHVYGCDWGAGYLEYGRAAGLILECGSCESLGRYAPADLVVLNHVLEHFVEPENELRRIRSLMRPGGVLYVEVPGLFSVHRTYGDLFLYLQNAHVYHYSLATLSKLMARAGFELVVGDEEISSAWRRAAVRTEGGPSDRMHYRAVMSYLWITEAARRSRLSTLADLGFRVVSRIMSPSRGWR